MNANRSFRIVELIVLALLATSLVPMAASAQVFKASFTLPVESRWGTTILPPGPYTVTLDSQGFPNIAKVQGESFSILVMPSVVDENHAYGPSKVLIARSGGRARIRAVCFGNLGTTYWYPQPKSEKLVLAQAPELMEGLPLAMGGK